MDKKKELKNLLDSAGNRLIDKLAVVKYLSKKDTKTVSSVVSSILKKKNNYFFSTTKKTYPWCQSLH